MYIICYAGFGDASLWEEFRERTSSEGIEATPWPKQTLQKAANGAYKGHLFAAQSIQTPQIITKTHNTKIRGVGGGNQPTKVTQSVANALGVLWPPLIIPSTSRVFLHHGGPRKVRTSAGGQSVGTPGDWSALSMSKPVAATRFLPSFVKIGRAHV